MVEEVPEAKGFFKMKKSKPRRSHKSKRLCTAAGKREKLFNNSKIRFVASITSKISSKTIYDKNFREEPFENANKDREGF